MDDWIHTAKILCKKEETQFFFFYYSGHGFIKSNRTIGVDKMGEELQIE